MVINWASLALLLITWATVIAEESNRSQLIGVKAEGHPAEGGVEDRTTIEVGHRTLLRFFGRNLSNRTRWTLTETSGKRYSHCDDLEHSESFTFDRIWPNGDMAIAFIAANKSNSYIRYFCLKEETGEPSDTWIHQGSEPWLTLALTTPLMPIYVQIVLICALLCLSGLFAGLNLGLMSLDKNELLVISHSGTDLEKRYAKTIEPIRRKGNYLLCTILLSNVMINSTLTVFLDQLTTGVIAVITSTLSIVIFGDIIPQAICSRHGLAIGAKTIYITYLFMAITFPLSWPVSKVLDWVLGDEIGQVYDRQKLMEFIRVTKDYSKLENEEVQMITGALRLRTITADAVMTRLEDVFMLNVDSILDFDTVSLIQKRGYSRIPVYDEERKNIVAIFYAKDLAFVDPNDKMPLRTIISFYKHPVQVVDHDETLDKVLNQFKQGKSHLSLVKQYFYSNDEDPYFEITGIITLEDVIEEIIQAEIVDETDTLSDNRRKQRRKIDAKQDFTEFSKIGVGYGNSLISPQMAVAAYQFLTSSVEPFTAKHLSDEIVRRLLSQRIYFVHRIAKDDSNDKDESPRAIQLYKQGEPCDYFVLLLEGRVRVTTGKEKLIFHSGPFSYFGVDAVRNPLDDNEEMSKFIPEYDVEVIDTSTYIKIPRQIYIIAYRASREISLDAGNQTDPSQAFVDMGTAGPNGHLNPALLLHSYSSGVASLESPERLSVVSQLFERAISQTSSHSGSVELGPILSSNREHLDQYNHENNGRF